MQYRLYGTCLLICDLSEHLERSYLYGLIMADSLYRKILYFKIRPFEFLVSMPALKCE